jgi:hypothetical protein
MKNCTLVFFLHLVIEKKSTYHTITTTTYIGIGFFLGQKRMSNFTFISLMCVTNAHAILHD